MIGVWVNSIAVLAGGAIGTFLRGGIPERFRAIINHALALCVLLIGIMGAIKTEDAMLLILCIVLGSIAGEALRVEDRLDALGAFARKKLAKDDSSFAQGFISATLLFCVGSMAIIGSMEAGMAGNASTLLAKSVLDGVSSIVFASSMGVGVCLSALPLTIYQGGIALLSRVAGQALSDVMIREMSAVGSVLIIALGIDMLDVMGEKRIKVGNMLPAVFLPIAYIPLADFLRGLF